MNALLTGIVPVFAMIALGWGLKKRAFLADDGWRAVERLTYFAFYPAFLIPAVWRADFAGGTAGPVALGTVGAAMVVAGLTVLAKPALKISDPAFTSVFQGVIRWNGFVFLPVAGAVLDAGCGTGVLAIAARRLGFEDVTAVDSDPLSVEATVANARRNGVGLTVARPLRVVAGRVDDLDTRLRRLEATARERVPAG